MEEELQEALRHFDKNGEGCIEADELKEVLMSLGEPMDDEDVAEMLRVAEVAGDGKINYYGNGVLGASRRGEPGATKLHDVLRVKGKL